MMFSRRDFLQCTAAGGAFALGFGRSIAAVDNGGAIATLNPWVRIEPSGRVEIIVSQAEMGQGIHTTLPAIIAEELDADWSKVSLRMSPVDKAYVNPRVGTQFTGNAESIRTFYPHLRRLGASAREMLVRAAAKRWRVSARRCRTREGRVLFGRRSLSYGELAMDAAKLRPPAEPRLKDVSEWKLLRRSLPRAELREKVTGAPLFGIDVERPNMLHGTVVHCPVHGGRFIGLDTTEAQASPGVRAVLEVPGRRDKGCAAVVVVADRWWQARKAATRLRFEIGGRKFSNGDVTPSVDGDDWTVVHSEGEETSASATTVSATFRSAWQSHAPMEPMNCTAEVTEDAVQLWAPTQGQTMCVTEVSKALGMPEARISVHRTFLGGGFGRRLIADYAVQAALASRAVGGRPVKLLWTRAQDIRHDHYRPGVAVRMTAKLDASGAPIEVTADVASATILSAVISFRGPFKHPEIDPSCLEGLHSRDQIYGFDRLVVRSFLPDVPVATMVWRTTGYGPNAFAVECFVDELAARAGRDPIAFRRSLLLRKKNQARAIAVLDKIREVSNWRQVPSNRYQGVALSYCFETYIAQVVELSVDDEGVIDLHRVVTVLDGGYVLDPDITKANIQGGIVWGLSQALTSEISFQAGQVEQSNFHDYEILSLAEAPPTEFHFIDSGADLGGLGEVGPVPTTPALVNAIAAATGKRLRTLPLSRHGFRTRSRARGRPI